MAQVTWWTKGGENKLGVGSLEGNDMSTLSSSTKTIRIHYVKKDVNFTTNLASEPSFPPQFHEALMFHVMQRLYAKEQNLQMAGWYRSQYKDVLIRAKKHANMNLQGDGYSLVLYQQVS